mgnify:FL=1
MKKILLISCVLLSACSGVTQTPTVGAREGVAAAAAVYSTAWTGFRAYAQLPRCNPAPEPCKEPALVVDLGTKLILARDAIDRARDVVNLLPEGKAPTAEQQAIIDAAKAAAANAASATQGVGQ